VPSAVHPDRAGPECRAERIGVDGGSRRPLAVAVPLEQVDFALAAGKVIGQPPGWPATAGEAVEFDPGFPGGAKAAPPVAADQAAEVVVAVSGGAPNEIGLPSRNTFSRLSRYCPQNSGLSKPTGFLTGVRFDETAHFDGSGAEPAGPSNSSWNTKPPGLGAGRRRGRRRCRTRRSLRS
jgi:hypothetical protein